jgi:hypothetical protein
MGPRRYDEIDEIFLSMTNFELGEKTMSARVKEALVDFNTANQL